MAMKKSILAGVCAACAAMVVVGGGYAVSISGYPTLLKKSRAVVQEQLTATFVDLIGNPAKFSVDFAEPRSALFNHELTMVIVNEDNSNIWRIPTTIDTKFLGYDFNFDLAHATVNGEHALKNLGFTGITSLESTASYHILADKFKFNVDASYLTNGEAIVNIAAHLKALNSYFEQQQAQNTQETSAVASEAITTEVATTEVATTEAAITEVATNEAVASDVATTEVASTDVANTDVATAEAPTTEVVPDAQVTEEVTLAEEATAPVAIENAQVATTEDPVEAKDEAASEDDVANRKVNEMSSQYAAQLKKDINLKEVGNLSFALISSSDEKVILSLEVDSLVQHNVIWQDLRLFTQFYGLQNLKSLEQLDIAAGGIAVINNDGYNLVKDAVLHLNNARRGVASKNFVFTLDAAKGDKLVDYHTSGTIQNLDIAKLDDQDLPLSFGQYLEQHPVTVTFAPSSSFGLDTMLKKDEQSEAVPTVIPVSFSGALGSYISETALNGENQNGNGATVLKHPVFYSDFVFNADANLSLVDDAAMSEFKDLFVVSGNKSSAQVRYEFDGYDDKLIVNGQEQ